MPLEENMEYAIQVQDVSKVYQLYDKKRRDSRHYWHQWFGKIYDIKDYYRCADPNIRGGKSFWSDFRLAGTGRWVQYGLYRN